ncbi:ThiF family adenylyltransferase [Corynebacterium accolens]|uniref:ThiF family adenylyltransferase n=1 Tax=Corynebacterium accolens TaxID=38284 RepID=A0ABT7FS36_9CORY|nr:ThiF family adenylyltransferase [Corynebacterium accolens]MDK4248285.1 ThiF family adenylyltransferase [Corynebacterium accolens]MDK4324595.1 ThiF family adenylyltransferase [Corynebacterium accolens]
MSQLPREELRRAARQTLLPGYGITQQEALHGTHVFVIGAGGLGCPLMQQLAAAGVGEISVIDDDTVDLTNIHRQILFGAQDVGRSKVEVAAEKLEQLQPGIVVHAIRDRLTADNAVDYLRGVDILVDGSDTFATKFLAADAAEITGTPLVWGSVLRFRGDCAVWWSGPGAESGVGMRDLYPLQPDPDSVPDCATAGVLGVTTSVVAGLMSTELIQFVTGINRDRVGLLSIYDALTSSITHFRVPHDPARELTTQLQHNYGGAACALPGAEDTAAMFDDLRAGAVAIDVREAGEAAIDDFFFDATAKHYHLPTTVWQEDPEAARSLLDSLQGAGLSDAWVYCASGKRSASFISAYAEDAEQRDITLHNVAGGIKSQPATFHGMPEH